MSTATWTRSTPSPMHELASPEDRAMTTTLQSGVKVRLTARKAFYPGDPRPWEPQFYWTYWLEAEDRSFCMVVRPDQAWEPRWPDITARDLAWLRGEG